MKRNKSSNNHQTLVSSGTEIGVVSTIANKLCQVLIEDRLVNCVVPNSLLSQRNALVVNDRVKVVSISHDQYRIVEVSPRINTLYRGDRKSSGHEILVAANVDYVVAVVSADYLLTQAGFFEASLIAAKRGGVKPILFVSKWDLVSEAAHTLLNNKLSLYRNEAHAVIVGERQAPEQFATLLKGKSAVVIGDRGYGKTTLIQAIICSLTGATPPTKTSSTHTTTLHVGPEGTVIIDTPGVRDLAISKVSDVERELIFPEITSIADNCQFRNCTHVHEAGCQVISALRLGTIRRERYDAYQSTRMETQKSTHRQKDYSPKVDYRHEACAESFYCQKCGEPVAPTGAGTEHRNHCPKCLSSLHVDERPGDRASLCRGLMEPVSVWVRSGGEWAIIHRCRECGALSSNRIAADDNPVLLMSLAVRPLSMPPFPLHTLDATGS